MQRRLFIVRHGKSSWESVVDDIDRPLTDRGVKNSYEMAERFQAAGLSPQAIYTSPANRAHHTAMIMASVWDTKEQHIHIRRNLYLPKLDDIAEVIFEVSDDIGSVAIFGHNPGFTQFANRFLEQPLENLPTAGIAVITMDLDSWTMLFQGKISNIIVDYPKMS